MISFSFISYLCVLVCSWISVASAASVTLHEFDAPRIGLTPRSLQSVNGLLVFDGVSATGVDAQSRTPLVLDTDNKVYALDDTIDLRMFSIDALGERVPALNQFLGVQNVTRLSDTAFVFQTKPVAYDQYARFESVRKGLLTENQISFSRFKHT
jgi:hypothetical protein